MPAGCADGKTSEPNTDGSPGTILRENLDPAFNAFCQVWAGKDIVPDPYAPPPRFPLWASAAEGGFSDANSTMSEPPAANCEAAKLIPGMARANRGLCEVFHSFGE